MRLEGKVALISGGARGMGAVEARLFAKEGAKVGIADILEEEGQRLEAEIAEAGGEAIFLKLDVTNERDWQQAVDALVSRFGKLDVLVNNAGYNINAPMLAMKLDQYDAVASIARGTWYLTKLVLRRFMLRKGSGRIINISSVVGHTGNPGQIPYTMVKAGLDAFTKSLAQELAGRDILVNAIAPGFIETEMTEELPDEVRETILAKIPMGRVGTAEEIADVVAFLATRGSYINGSVLHVNGGMYGG